MEEGKISRKLGLIGGISWISTRSYYEDINRIVQRKIGPRASAPMLIESLDFSSLCALVKEEDWDRAGDVLVASAQRLAAAGAGALLIAANSMHKVYDRVAGAIDIPVFHIADCLGARMKADQRLSGAALLGTRNVVTGSYYRQRLVSLGIDLMPPNMRLVDEVDRIIYNELVAGKVTRDAERSMKSIITIMEQEGARSIVLASTELNLVVGVDANILPVYDSTRIHAERAAAWILGED